MRKELEISSVVNNISGAMCARSELAEYAGLTQDFRHDFYSIQITRVRAIDRAVAMLEIARDDVAIVAGFKTDTRDYDVGAFTGKTFGFRGGEDAKKTLNLIMSLTDAMDSLLFVKIGRALDGKSRRQAFKMIDKVRSGYNRLYREYDDKCENAFDPIVNWYAARIESDKVNA